MSTPLPFLGNNLTPDSTTREVLAFLCDEYNRKTPDFAQARLALEAWADELSHSDGGQDTFSLLAPDQSIAMRDLLGAMERQQASRFLGELFTDVVPHVSSKSRLLRDIVEEKTSSGVEIRRPRLLDPVFQALRSLSPGQARAEARVLSLTRKDDGLTHIQSQVAVEFEVEGDPSPRRRNSARPF